MWVLVWVKSNNAKQRGILTWEKSQMRDGCMRKITQYQRNTLWDGSMGKITNVKPCGVDVWVNSLNDKVKQYWMVDRSMGKITNIKQYEVVTWVNSLVNVKECVKVAWVKSFMFNNVGLL